MFGARGAAPWHQTPTLTPSLTPYRVAVLPHLGDDGLAREYGGGEAAPHRLEHLPRGTRSGLAPYCRPLPVGKCTWDGFLLGGLGVVAATGGEDMAGSEAQGAEAVIDRCGEAHHLGELKAAGLGM